MKIVDVHPGYKSMTDEQLAEHIRERLGMNPAWARRALLALYDEQTEAEKADPTFHESNGMGFSPNDQEFLSSLAEQALRNETFSQKQLGWLYTLLPKYAKQMVKIVRSLEKLEKVMVTELFYLQITVDNSMRMMKGYTTPLNLDPRDMPNEIVIRSPSNELRHLFTIKEVYTNEGVASAFVYTTKIKDVEWTLYITVGDDEYEEPEIVKNMGKAFGV